VLVDILYRNSGSNCSVDVDGTVIRCSFFGSRSQWCQVKKIY